MYPDIAKAFIINQEDWDEILRVEGKKAGIPYVVPDKKNKVISIRFPDEYKNQEVLVLVRKPKPDTKEVKQENT
jgi:hypothetical protein